MRNLPAPPPWLQHISAALEVYQRPEMRELVAKINRDYLHWDKVRFQRRPAGITPEVLWSVVKFSRQSPRTPIGLADAAGQRFSFTLPDAAQPILHEVDRGGGGLLAVSEGAAPRLRALHHRVIVNSLMEEAIATSQIEGAVTTREVAKEMLRTRRKPRDRSEQMIVNGYRTIQLIRDRLDRPLSLDLLFEIQESMTRDTLDDPARAGAFRTGDDKIAIVDTRDEKIVYTPPPAELLPERMQRLLAFANEPANEHRFIHPLVKAGILHFWLAYEHPFIDGNGRTARALFYWWMLRSGYWLFEYLTISRVIFDSRVQYYHSFLFAEEDENDLTYSVMYQLRATHKALKKMRDYLAQKQAELRAVDAALKDTPDLNPRQRATLQELAHDPNRICTFQSYAAENGVSLLTARKDLLDLTRRAFVIRVRAGKQHEFVAARKLAKRLGTSKND